MKTSKIIFISFFCIIGLFLLSMLIQTEKKTRIDFFLTKAVLPPFSHLIINDSEGIEVKLSTIDSIFVYHKPNTKALMPDYRLQKDTLFITWPKHQNGMTWQNSINCSKLKSITLKHSKIDLRGLDADSLNICVHANSNLQCNMDHINLVKLEMSHSEANFNTQKIEHLQAVVRDSSNLSTWKVLRTDVTVDETSRYYSR